MCRVAFSLGRLGSLLHCGHFVFEKLHGLVPDGEILQAAHTTDEGHGTSPVSQGLDELGNLGLCSLEL